MKNLPLSIAIVSLIIVVSSPAIADPPGRVLLTGNDLSPWNGDTGGWKIVGDAKNDEKTQRRLLTSEGTGVLASRPNGKDANLFSKQAFGDVKTHFEFMVPTKSNSGIYFMGRYELQIFDSHGVDEREMSFDACGSIYARGERPNKYEGHPPRVNASKPAGEWQTFDVVFRAPRFDEDGKKTENARFVKVVHNGVLVHENVPVTGPTGGAPFIDETATGPIMIQGDHGPIAYRNCWVEERRDAAGEEAGSGAPAMIVDVTSRPSGRPAFPRYTLDGDLNTFWAAQCWRLQHWREHHKEQWITYHLNRPVSIDRVAMVWGTAKPLDFEVRTSRDGTSWETAFKGNSEGVVDEWRQAEFPPVGATMVRLVVKGLDPDCWHRVKEVKIGDLPFEPTPCVLRRFRTWPSGPPTTAELATAELAACKPAKPLPYHEMATKCLRTIRDRANDRYGTAHAPIWVLNFDLETKECFPRYNDALEERGAVGLGYSSTVPYGLGYRAIRASQRPAGCSNLLVDQPMIRAATLLDLLEGEKEFTAPVDDYVRWVFDNLTDSETGLLNWGIHTSYDVFHENLHQSDGAQHEVQCILPIWPVFDRVDAERTGAYLSKFWHRHTDPRTGIVDRHATRGRGLDFSMAAGEVILVCAYLHTKDPDGPWLDRALQVAHSHYDTRNPKTNLFVNTARGGTGKRFDNTYSDTSVTGLWASRVLLAGRITGNEELTEMARTTLRAWAKYGWDEKEKKPWSSLRPDGTPHDKERDYSGVKYSKFDPSGHWDFWKDYVYGFEYPFATLMTYAAAADWLDDPVLENHAKRLAECYRKLLPAGGDVGAFAANYGQLISFYLAMERLTGDASYRETAKQVADEAVAHLWTGDCFRGFACRTHYSAVEGAGYLVQALVELDADPIRLAEIQKQHVFLINF